jgi:S1-C subfamily serine protease
MPDRQSKMTVRMVRWTRLGPLLLASTLIGSAAGQEPSPPAIPPAAPGDAAAVAASASGAMAVQQAVVEAIAAAEKSLVAIARVPKDRTAENTPLEFRPDAFGRRMATVTPAGPTDPDFVPRDFATGVIVDRQGLILTAYHALGEDNDYYVTTFGRKVYRAWIKGADPRSDLAVLAIEAADLAPIVMGDAARLKKGQIVIALGNPYAIARDGQPSASWGIVANLARKAPLGPEDFDAPGKSTLHHYGTLIQTDAKLNFGTSGGALLNLKGQMVGLTTSLAALAGYEQPAGYAFPVDATFRRVVETLKQGREVEYGLLGIQPTGLSLPEMMRGMHGTRVHRVVSGSPAQRFGVRDGDVVTAVNGTPIYDPDGLVLEVGKLPVEAVVRLSLLREEQKLNLDVTLSKFPVSGKKIVTAPPPSWRGLRIDYTTAVPETDLLSSITAPSFDEAVVVTEVDPNSPAWEAGLRPRDFICQVDQSPIRNPREFQAAVSGKSGAVQLRLYGDSGEKPQTRTVGPGS